MQCPLFYSQNNQDTPLGILRLYTSGCQPTCLCQNTNQGNGTESCAFLVVPLAVQGNTGWPTFFNCFVAGSAPFLRAELYYLRLVGTISPSSGRPGTLGLLCGRFNLTTSWLPDSVIITRVSSMRSVYRITANGTILRRGAWPHGQLPSSVPFLQELLDRGKVFSTIKVYLAAISACHVGFENATVACQGLVADGCKYRIFFY